jgi:phosphatidylglycerophosphate synthase
MKGDRDMSTAAISAPTVAAVILDSPAPVVLGGLTITDRNVRLAERAGFAPVLVAGRHAIDETVTAALPVVVISANVLLDVAALEAIGAAARANRMGHLVARDAQGLLVSAVPARRAAGLLAAGSIDAIAAQHALPRRDLDPGGGFIRRVTAETAPRAERDYVRHLNGGSSESFFTKVIRRFSVPLSIRLVRLGATPTQVTMGGLALAVGSAICLAQDQYAAGLVGALLYYASMVFDCSDGEVARLSVRDSSFGAWLETIVDYTTYLLVLGALTIGVGGRADAASFRLAALVALVGSVVVMIVAGYLRHRVAAADPGQFDEWSAKALAAAGPMHRFARWGRQWVKRSSVAHLIVALAIVNQLPLLLYLWAFGAAVATIAILIVEPLVVRRVSVPPVGAPRLGAGR